MLQSHEQFLSSLEISKLRAQNRPDLIFLCGGKYSPAPSPVKSVRHFLLLKLQETNSPLFRRLMLADDINDWFDGSVFDDLLHLEEQIAHLSSLIVLFAESIGSYAELGAFALAPPFNQKLLVISETKFAHARSFINLGPIRRVQTINVANAASFPWYVSDSDYNLNLTDLEGAADDIIETISQAAQPKTSSEKFTLDNDAHVLLFAADIVNLLTAIRETELREIFAFLGNPLSLQRTRQILFVLEKMKLIYRVKYTAQEFFMSNLSRAFIDYAYKPEATQTDRERIKFYFRDRYPHEDSRRHRAIKAGLKQMSASATSHTETSAR